MQKTSFKARFVVPLLAVILALAFAPAAFAANETGEDDPTAPFGPGAVFENAEITIDSGQAIVYTGNAKKPKISVWLLNEETGEKELLTKGVDYKVFYKDNVDAGLALACAWCQDEEHMYIVKKKFRIVKAPITSAKVKIGKKLYTGKKLTPTPQVTYKGKKLTKDVDFTVTYKKNKNAGLATATIKGIGNFKGKMTKNFRIMKANLAKAKTTKMKQWVYTGSKIQPKVNVKYKGTKLRVNRDYTIRYKSNVNAGTASIVLKGKGNFKGNRILKFTIKKASIKKCSVSYQKSWHWNGSLIKPTVTLTYKGKKLTQGKDYLVGYASNEQVGTAYINIQGKGNFTGTDRQTFEITLLPLTDSSITTIPANGALYNYTGEPILPLVTVKINSGGKTYVVSPNYYDVFYSQGGNFYTRDQALAQGLFKGNKKKDKIYHIRIQAKEGSNFFTGYRTVNYTILKQANQA